MPLKSLDALIRAGLIHSEQRQALAPVVERFAVAVSPEMARIIRSPLGPVGKQYLPSVAELTILSQERQDPIGDGPHTPIAGVTRRYPDRALLKPVHVCPVYCRFCFRREQVGPEGEMLSLEQLQLALDWLDGQPQLREVILSGGDPLVMSPGRLRPIVERIGAMAHVELLRVHSRVPVVQPERVGAQMIAALQAGPVPWVVVHVNHAQELTASAQAALGRLVDAGIPVLSQSVLLAGVNDDLEGLEQLFRMLVRLRVKPYYLHHGDLAQGTGHFRVPLARGQELMRGLRGRVSGMALPTYMLDIPGGHGKVPVGPVYAQQREQGWAVQDPWGGEHCVEEHSVEE